MFEFLDKFHERMEMIAISDSILNRKGKNKEIEDLFQENELDNIIIAVLLFIMEKTLEENNECEIFHIEQFLEGLFDEYYNKSFNSSDTKIITSYIVKTILQNNGEKYSYRVKNYNNNTWEDKNIRLINDKIVEERNEKKLVYALTNQGYNFLFKTKEIDEEIKMTIEQLKLKEYIKRKKFSNAVRQSIELINYARQKKREIEALILSIRQNIHNVNVEDYEKLLKSTYSMLEDEYDAMNEIEKMMLQAEKKIKDEIDTLPEIDEKLINAGREIEIIHNNIGIILSEQRDLILDRHNLTDIYMDTIRKTFQYSFEKRFDFEKVILSGLERYKSELENYIGIIKPIIMPQYKKWIGIDEIYDQQIIVKEETCIVQEAIIIEEYDNSAEKLRLKELNAQYTRITELLIVPAVEDGEAKLSVIIEKLKTDNNMEFLTLAKNRKLFMIALKLYNIGELDLKAFFDEQRKVMMTNTEEYNVEQALIDIAERNPIIRDIDKVIVEKMPTEIKELFEYEENEAKIKEEITMSDIIFRTVRKWKE